MLETYEKFRMIDEAKKNNWFIEVNWEPTDEKTNKCKILKITFPNGEVAYLDKKYLLEMLFAIGQPEEQQKMIPQKLTKVKWYETTLGIRATKDIHKGEMINVPIKLTLPATEEEVISDIRRPSGTSNLIIPK